MPTFEIPDGPTSIDAVRASDPTGKQPAQPSQASAVFNVTNKSAESSAGRLSVQVAGASKAEWFTIDGERERTFAAGETQTATVKVAFPPDVAPGSYPFRLRAVAVADPDNDHAEGAVATVNLKGAVVPPPPRKWWIWILIALVALAVIGGGVYYFLKPHPKPGPAPGPEPVSQPQPVASAVPNLVDKTVDQAKALATGVEIVPVAGPAGGKPPQTIVSQSPEAGQPHAAVIRVTVDPGVTVPSVIGSDVAQAVRTLQGVPLHIGRSTSKCETSGTADQILDQDPKAGTAVAKDAAVNVVVRTVGGSFGATRVRCGVLIPNVILRKEVLSDPVVKTMRIQPKIGGF